MSCIAGYVQSPDGIDTFVLATQAVGFSDAGIYRKKILLDSNKEYMVAIDQSTKSFGISIADRKFENICIFTLICEDKSPIVRERFVDCVLDFLENMMMGKKLIFLAIEEVPPPTNGRMHTYQILKELRGKVRNRVAAFPSVREMPRDMEFKPYPSQWKSTVYDKKQSKKGRFNNKSEIANDICKICPKLREYKDLLDVTSIGSHDYDGFDSFGMLMHVRIKHFGKNWEVMNFNSQYQMGKIYVFMKYVDDDHVMDEVVLPFQQWSLLPDENNVPRDLVDTRHWMPDMSAYTNIIMAANTNKIIITECKNIKLILSYLVETGEKYLKDKSLYLIICKAGTASNYLVNEDWFNWLGKNGFHCKKYYKE